MGASLDVDSRISVDAESLGHGPVADALAQVAAEAKAWRECWEACAAAAQGENAEWRGVLLRAPEAAANESARWAAVAGRDGALGEVAKWRGSADRAVAVLEHASDRLSAALEDSFRVSQREVAAVRTDVTPLLRGALAGVWECLTTLETSAMPLQRSVERAVNHMAQNVLSFPPTPPF
eukprot:TRINITY_DN4294_c0_g1_i3.p1 TRINITY_DN4294_c0_g1~~TRINITY_DN4294_c0_g1_i3.p1  ORF type:complete len:179 (+),score=40.41 TRINITY_DN4294_c0_g1_i3:92-628(+)